MRTRNSYRIILAAAAFALIAGATESRADSCSASASSLITRSSGGTCGAALSLHQEITLDYKIQNASIIDDPMSANDGDPIQATIQSGAEIVGTLAQATAGVGGMQLPSVLEFLPVCSAGSSMNAGLTCDPMAPNCGTGNCGCLSNLPGVTCVASGGNIVNLEIGQDVVFNPGQQRTIASIKVKVTDTVDTGSCGEFFSRMDSTGDVIETTDIQCDSTVTAGAQASADLHAPPCASDADCGDTECNVCADIATDPHCEVANIGNACGTDSDPDDCTTPACVNVDGVGECQQDQNNEPLDTPCGGDGVDCTTDLCNANGVCEHTEDNSFCDDLDECTTDICDAQLDCVHEFICEGEAICRSPGYWATHSGYEQKNENKDAVNVGQLVIDAVGPLDVCGQMIDSTSNLSSPYLAGLGLDSSLEGLCVKVQGVTERQLYRQLVAAALNCGISGDDCETVTDPFMGVSFDDCNDLCAGNMLVDPPTIGECISQLDCFNNGGQVVLGECAFGTCAGDGEYCGGDFGDCGLFMDAPQDCVDFPGNCHDQVLCNEDIGVCPKAAPASSSSACREARGNDCTIDDCN